VAATLGAFLYSPTDQVVVDLFSVVMFYLFGERVAVRAGKS